MNAYLIELDGSVCEVPTAVSTYVKMKLSGIRHKGYALGEAHPFYLSVVFCKILRGTYRTHRFQL